jgi:hypothetical protein
MLLLSSTMLLGLSLYFSFREIVIEKLLLLMLVNARMVIQRMRAFSRVEFGTRGTQEQKHNFLVPFLGSAPVGSQVGASRIYYDAWIRVIYNNSSPLN